MVYRSATKTLDDVHVITHEVQKTPVRPILHRVTMKKMRLPPIHPTNVLAEPLFL